MPDEPRNLWPPEVTVDALSPAMMLNEQVEALAKRTKGLLRGELLLDVSDVIAKLVFDLVAPAVGFRHRILVVRYSQTQPYPAVVSAAPLVNYSKVGPLPGSDWRLENAEQPLSRLAFTPAEFENLLVFILGSPSLKSVVLSLIARSNEVKNPPRVRYQPGATESATQQTVAVLEPGLQAEKPETLEGTSSS